jgi:hypothetical protein
MTPSRDMLRAGWRKSIRSNQEGACVEILRLPQTPLDLGSSTAERADDRDDCRK